MFSIPLAGFVQVLVILMGYGATSLGRNHCCLALCLKSLNHSRIRIVSFVRFTPCRTLAWAAGSRLHRERRLVPVSGESLRLLPNASTTA